MRTRLFTLPRRLFFLFVLALVPTVACAQARDGVDNPDIIHSEGFLRAHPDLRGRLAGLRAYEDGDHAEALKQFRRGARYGDKPSQGMIAQMYWMGEGVAADRATAYAWMDLAAERMYRVMVIQREVYWAAMDAAERERAIDVGTPLYAEYGDDVARRRLDILLRRERKKSTGSRLGGPAGALSIVLRTPNGPRTVDGSQFYHEDYWDVEKYHAYQDRDWKDAPTGRVEIGPLTTGDAVEPVPQDKD